MYESLNDLLNYHTSKKKTKSVEELLAQYSKERHERMAKMYSDVSKSLKKSTG